MSGWRLGAVAVPRTPEGRWLALPVGEEDGGKEERIWNSGSAFESFMGMLAFIGGGVRATDVDGALGVCVPGLLREMHEECGLKRGVLTELPGSYAVEQRGNRNAKFVVASFMLDLTKDMVADLIKRGATEVSDSRVLRPRDRWIFETFAMPAATIRVLVESSHE